MGYSINLYPKVVLYSIKDLSRPKSQLSYFSILLGTGIDGRKFKPLVIGHTKGPRSMIDTDYNILDVNYVHSKSGSITPSLRLVRLLPFLFDRNKRKHTVPVGG